MELWTCRRARGECRGLAVDLARVGPVQYAGCVAGDSLFDELCIGGFCWVHGHVRSVVYRSCEEG